MNKCWPNKFVGSLNNECMTAKKYDINLKLASAYQNQNNCNLSENHQSMR